ncbi:hypothetical protein Q2379_26425, partial [Escherichia coli]|nr:hypothetical protein [Escherichia coli]
PTAQNDESPPLVPGALTGFPVAKLHNSPGQKKPTWCRWQESESIGNILVIGCDIYTNAKNAAVMP